MFSAISVILRGTVLVDSGTQAVALLALSPTITFAITLAAGFISVSPFTSVAPIHYERLPTLHIFTSRHTAHCFLQPLNIVAPILEEFHCFVVVFFMFVIEVALEVG
jgi:hypothetical protein